MKQQATVLVIANQKGGVGKTTTTVNLGASLAALGKRVLIVDIDPQGNATSGLGVDKRALSNSIYDVLINDRIFNSALIKRLFRAIYIASNID